VVRGLEVRTTVNVNYEWIDKEVVEKQKEMSGLNVEQE